MKLKKIMLVSLVLTLIALPFIAAFSTATVSADGICGCKHDYMGAKLIFSECGLDAETGEFWRHCHYSY